MRCLQISIQGFRADKQQILIQCTAHHLHINWTVLVPSKFNEKPSSILGAWWYRTVTRSTWTNNLPMNSIWAALLAVVVRFFFLQFAIGFYFSICRSLKLDSLTITAILPWITTTFSSHSFALALISCLKWAKQVNKQATLCTEHALAWESVSIRFENVKWTALHSRVYH